MRDRFLSNRNLAAFLLSSALCALHSAAIAGTVYKWVDERGIAHYSNQPVPGKAVQAIEVQAGPCPEDVERARQAAERDKHEAERMQIAREHPPRPSAAELGPLPPNATSEYLRTLGTGFIYHFDEQRLLFRYWINVRAMTDLPVGTYLEFHFDDPVHYDQVVVVGKTVEVNEQGVKVLDFAVQSPELEGIQCKNYEIMVEVYNNKAKTVLLGRHRQIDQSRVDSALAVTPEELVKRLGAPGGCCP
jgi:hypothetical protein